MKPIETKGRSVVKAISYRILGTFLTIILVFILTNKWKVAFSAGVFEIFLKIVFYYWHDRVWQKISWGQIKHKPQVIWFTGLSGAGKSTLAQRLLKDLKARELPVELLDGDEVRSIFKNIGFTRSDRLKHLEMMAFIAAKIERQGSIVIGSFITPYQEARDNLRNSCQHYLEVWIDTSLYECEKRDVKGLYAKARSGEVTSFTGITDAFEEPNSYDIKISTQGKSIDESYAELLSELKKKVDFLN